MILPRTRSGTGVRRRGAANREASGPCEFFVRGDVNDAEFFRVQHRVGTEQQLAVVTLLHFGDQFFVLCTQPIEHGRVDHDLELEIRLVALPFLENLRELALNLHAHGSGALDFATAFAIGACVIDGRADAFAVAKSKAPSPWAWRFSAS